MSEAMWFEENAERIGRLERVRTHAAEVATYMNVLVPKPGEKWDGHQLLPDALKGLAALDRLNLALAACDQPPTQYGEWSEFVANAPGARRAVSRSRAVNPAGGEVEHGE